MPDPEIAVRADMLTRTFGSFTAVDAVSFAVRRGEIFGFLGANGAGKTTVIRMLCGLLPPTSGSAAVGGFDIATQASSIKKRIGYMSQRFSLYEDLTVSHNLDFFGGVYGLRKQEVRERSHAILRQLRLEQQSDAVTRSLPLGWKQRLALASALLHDPEIIFLDEPTGGVDPISRRNFWRIMYDLASEGKTIFVTTHFMDEAEYCHRISFMHQGRMIDIGNPTQLKERYGKGSIQEVFLHLVSEANRDD